MNSSTAEEILCLFLLKIEVNQYTLLFNFTKFADLEYLANSFKSIR